MLNYKQLVKEKKMKRIKNNSQGHISNATNPSITVRLNKKTIITIKDSSKFAYWKEKYPDEVII